MKKKLFFIILLLFLIPSFYGYGKQKQIILKIFHAGSLSVPFSAMEKVFEKQYPWIDVQLEGSGSVLAIRKVIDFHKPCDVVASADYSLIPAMMFPYYSNYVKMFAKNQLVLCYTDKSKFSSKINTHNWYGVLPKTGVIWGFPNPNLDPCGYRTVIAIVLAEKYYNVNLFDQLLASYLPFTIIKTGNNFTINISKNFEPRGHKVTVRPKSVELISLLQGGAIDYAFEYRSIALQHHLSFIKLPQQINLSDMKYRDFYRTVTAKLGNGKTVIGKPIVYGITVVKNSPHPKEAHLWEDFVTSKEGARILTKYYQIPIYPTKMVLVK